MKKVLLIGQGGYIGTAVSNYLAKYPDYKVDSVSSMNEEWSLISFTGYDAVYNVSGLAHANARKGTEEQYYDVNGRLPIKVAEKAKKEGVPLFIQMSSMIVYGDMSELYKDKMITANTVPEESTVYGKSKMYAERGLNKLAEDGFQVAIIRPPLIYGKDARDNFPRLVKFAKTFPVFPKLHNSQSMLYIDNLCELVRLIIDNNQGGTYYPQQEVYIETSKLVKDFSDAFGKKMVLTKIFNPLLRLLSPCFGFIHKAFGSITYEMSMSDSFDGKYRVVGYEESVKRIAQSIN